MFALLVFANIQSAQAGIAYSVDFIGTYAGAGNEGSNPLPDNNAFGPTGAVYNNWNQFLWGTTVNQGGGSKNFSMHDSSNANPITLNVAMHNAGGADGGGDTASDINALYHSGLRDNDGIITVTTAANPFGGTTPYDLYVYSGGNPNDDGSHPAGQFILNNNYTLTTGLTGALSFQIGSLNGFSIVNQVPEPGTAVSLLGGLGMLIGLRRSRARRSH